MVVTLYCILLRHGLRIPLIARVCQLILGAHRWSLWCGEHPQSPPPLTSAGSEIKQMSQKHWYNCFENWRKVSSDSINHVLIHSPHPLFCCQFVCHLAYVAVVHSTIPITVWMIPNLIYQSWQWMYIHAAEERRTWSNPAAVGFQHTRPHYATFYNFL